MSRPLRVEPDEPQEGGQKISQADRLVRLARARYWFGRSIAGEPFAVPFDGPRIPRFLRGGRESLRAELAALYNTQHEKAPSSSALADALLVVEGLAQSADSVTLEVRVARDGEALYLDLGDATGRAVEIDAAGWRVVDSAPVLFRRSEIARALPEPEPGGTLDDLRELCNVGDESWPLLLAWMVAALVPEIPHPILLLTGPQDAAKTTTARIIASTIDPSAAPVRSAPRDEERWAIAAAGSWVVPLDNLSRIPEWLSDALCRSVTGEGYLKRRLYSDDSLVVLAFRRVVILTSIDPGGLRGDLGDRLMVVDLEQLPDDRRKEDSEIAAAFERAHPKILGALLDLLASVLRVLPEVRPARLPRMADAARVFAAVDRVQKTHAFETYLGLRGRIAADVVEGDPVAEAVRALGEWSGTASELFEKISPERPPREWPKNARALSAVLRRAIGPLKAVGVEVAFDRPGGKARLIHIGEQRH